MKGTPPNCRPECIINQECPPTRSCIAGRCQNPCEGACGNSAYCTVRNHIPSCECNEGYEGDPYSGCFAKRGKFLFHVFFFPTIHSFLLNYISLHSLYLLCKYLLLLYIFKFPHIFFHFISSFSLLFMFFYILYFHYFMFEKKIIFLI